MSGLVYISRRAPGLDLTQIVDGIVLPAGAKNRRLDITGCLWIGPTRFAQVLEGAEDRVASLFEKIERDGRHTDVQLVWRGDIEARVFPRWGMRHVEGDDRDELGLIVSEYLGSRGVTSVIDGEGTLQRGFGTKILRALANLAG